MRDLLAAMNDEEEVDEVFECPVVELFEEVAKTSKMMRMKVRRTDPVSEIMTQ